MLEVKGLLKWILEGFIEGFITGFLEGVLREFVRETKHVVGIKNDGGTQSCAQPMLFIALQNTLDSRP